MFPTIFFFFWRAALQLSFLLVKKAQKKKKPGQESELFDSTHLSYYSTIEKQVQEVFKK
ncbi:MAG: hypothetical protein II709_09210 [Ruminococcus sp.]|nr:hypothetical protein [uncultured Ruminococcus sp.]MBQ1349603.1 hypothetical protein [Ruminococcus sp.]MBQ4262048.1 hypothetical protein [Ruminococcus sp.]